MIRLLAVAALFVSANVAFAFDCRLSVTGRSGGRSQQYDAESDAKATAESVFASACSEARCSCSSPSVGIIRSEPSPISEEWIAVALAEGHASGCQTPTAECPGR